MSDLISREDAIEAVRKIVPVETAIDSTLLDKAEVIGELSALPSAEPTVIRSRTLMPTKDFKEWAKRVREENPNVIVIPCDAEVVSAEAVSKKEKEYEETDGVIKIKKQSAKDVGEIKDIVVCSSNYTRYFYNDSMPTQYKGGDTE